MHMPGWSWLSPFLSRDILWIRWDICRMGMPSFVKPRHFFIPSPYDSRSLIVCSAWLSVLLWNTSIQTLPWTSLILTLLISFYYGKTVSVNVSVLTFFVLPEWLSPVSCSSSQSRWHTVLRLPRLRLPIGLSSSSMQMAFLNHPLWYPCFFMCFFREDTCECLP